MEHALGQPCLQEGHANGEPLCAANRLGETERTIGETRSLGFWKKKSFLLHDHGIRDKNEEFSKVFKSCRKVVNVAPLLTILLLQFPLHHTHTYFGPMEKCHNFSLQCIQSITANPVIVLYTESWKPNNYLRND